MTVLFLRLGFTSFGGPAAHVALIERECVRRRQWLTHDEFLDLLGVSNLIPGPTSTELAMHVGRRRAGWPGLVAAGVAFITPAALLVAGLAALYVGTGETPLARAVLAAVQPVVIVVVLDALLPLARSALSTPPHVAIGAASLAAVLAGVPEIAVLLLAGLARMASSAIVALLMAAGAAGGLAAAPHVAASVPAVDVFGYFAGIGAVMFGSGYVLLPVLEGDLVERMGWLTRAQLLDAIATGQATPGPVFTTATFIGYLLGGPWGALVATVGIFLPAFLCAAASSVFMDRLRRSAAARTFLSGVNAAAVALIGLVLVVLSQDALVSVWSLVILGMAAFLVFRVRASTSIVLAGAAAAGALAGLLRS